jgi:hypothetical protein
MSAVLHDDLNLHATHEETVRQPLDFRNKTHTQEIEVK